LKKVSILQFPRYDDKTDSFVDGTLPDTADTFFNNDSSMKDFFDIKPPRKHGHENIKADNIHH
jgi:hypothetical protein